MDHPSVPVAGPAGERGRWLRERLKDWWPVVPLRDALLLIALTAGVFAVAFLGFARMFTEPRTDAVARHVAAQLGGLADAFDRLPEPQREAFLDAVVAGSHGRIVRDDPLQWGLQEPDDEIARLALARMRHLLPVGRLAMTRGERQHMVWLALPAPGGDWYWLREPMPKAPSNWAIVALVSAALLVAVGALGSAYFAWRLRHRVGGMRRMIEGAGAAGLPAGPAMPEALDAGRSTDPQPHLEALAGRLASARRRRAGAAVATSASLRQGLAQLLASEPLVRDAQAAACVGALRTAVGRLDAFAARALAGAPGTGVPVSRGARLWRGVAGDIVLVVTLFALAIGCSGLVVTRAVVEPRAEGAADMMFTVIAGIQATYRAVPADHQVAYLNALSLYGSGMVQADDPARWPISDEARLQVVRKAIASLQQRLPGVPMRVTPWPDSLLWVQVTGIDGHPEWLRFTSPVLMPLRGLPLAGLGALLLGAAALVVLRARRRLAWFGRSIDAADPQLLPSDPGEEVPVMDEATRVMGQDLHRAATLLVRGGDEDELALAAFSEELGERLQALREAVPRATEAATTADLLEALSQQAAALDPFRRLAGEAAPATDVNAELRALRHQLEGQAGPLVLWSFGGVPLADIAEPDARRLFQYLLDEVMRHGDAPIEVSTSLEASRIVVRVTGHGHVPLRETGGSAGLEVARRIAEARQGLLHWSDGPGQGLEAQVWLRPARTVR